ncbi:acyl-CoA dehydrogenase [Bacillus sp. AFS076308]|uniref:acyl-CoA dehydrogenase family protein n=1 Tax=unclassified Bacillus (in: firmicutes) TaxID=185979 RepID=UPI000BF87354|nr:MULTISPECIES: acyl-CoA dehydrogenase family protein [unclassified Bacillus (in: firmicutes)]PFO05830.1 acyl-CoA dehydrogenase [Bacillus sp. AFS076308]PGV54143.1 acyl-CoA dehydrogenase [Bacillus sp. AFS037270]
MEQSVLDVKRELVENARSLIPTLREHSEEIEKTNTLPQAVIEEMKNKGTLKVLRPHLFGGYQTNMRTYTEVVTEISRGNGSAGWFCALSNIRDYMISYTFGEKALSEIYPPGKDVVLAGNFKPIKCNIKKVDGGYFIEEAQWPFVSGSPHADWCYFGFPIADDNGGVEMAIMVIPRDELEVLDDWYVMGLKGSGSNSCRIQNVFVPEHRVSLDRLASKGHYLVEPLKDVALYRSSFVPSLTLSIVAPALGLAQAAMDLYMERLPKAGIGNTFYHKQNEAPITHLQVAQAQLKIDSAELHLYRAVDKIDEYADRGMVMAQAEIVKVKADFGYVNQLCKEAIDLLVAGVGSMFTYETNALQRVYRDFLTMHLHGFITPSSLIETYGRVLCGQEPNTYFV